VQPRPRQFDQCDIKAQLLDLWINAVRAYANAIGPPEQGLAIDPNIEDLRSDVERAREAFDRHCASHRC
jgi:hypothetical protein